MNKLEVQQAIGRLESAALRSEGFSSRDRDNVQVDARRVRRFLNSERREIIILRRYVLLAASTLDESAGAESHASLVSEMREKARPHPRSRA